MSDMSVFSRERDLVNEEQWISVSDLMSALMMIFLLLSLFYMIHLNEERTAQTFSYELLVAKTKDVEKENQLLISKTRDVENDYRLLLSKSKNQEDNHNLLLSETKNLRDKEANARRLLAEKDKLLSETTSTAEELQLANSIKEKRLEEVLSEAVIYEDVIKELHQSLLGEFNADLNKWNAELRDDLTFRFNEPEVLFDTGESTIKPRFKSILNDFFPRYLRVITSEKFKNDIAEVRIEGHTSSIWANLPKYGMEAYFENMRLSQGRSRSTLFYVMALPESKLRYPWLKDKLTANGLSSSKLVDKDGYFITDENSDGLEDQLRSQRVEFRVRIDAESKITKMLNDAESG